MCEQFTLNAPHDWRTNWQPFDPTVPNNWQSIYQTIDKSIDAQMAHAVQPIHN